MYTFVEARGPLFSLVALYLYSLETVFLIKQEFSNSAKSVVDLHVTILQCQDSRFMLLCLVFACVYTVCWDLETFREIIRDTLVLYVWRDIILDQCLIICTSMMHISKYMSTSHWWITLLTFGFASAQKCTLRFVLPLAFGCPEMKQCVFLNAPTSSFAITSMSFSGSNILWPLTGAELCSII